MISTDSLRYEDGLASQLYAQIAARIREQILSGQLVAGQQLPRELDLAHELQVSRLTVRGALARLQHEGLIVKAARHPLHRPSDACPSDPGQP